MPVIGFTKFERFLRADWFAGCQRAGTSTDRIVLRTSKADVGRLQ